MTLNKHELRKFNKYNLHENVYLGWVEPDNYAVFIKEWDEYYNEEKTQWKKRNYGEVRVHIDDLTNGNFEYMIEKNLTRVD